MDISGWVGWALAVILGILNIGQLLKNKPIIIIEKVDYKHHRKFEELSPKEYAQKALSGEFNNGVLNYEIRELILNITNQGHRDACLKRVSPSYLQNSYIPKVINFKQVTIKSGDNEEVRLFFEFPTDIIREIEKTLSNIIWVDFDFVHKSIRKRFVIRK